MVGYSYFDYDQMTLLGIEVHSDELELLQQAADMYDWEIMDCIPPCVPPCPWAT